jgi:nicotinamidase-related amidase
VGLKLGTAENCHQAIKSVVVAGIFSDVCVAITAREAADRGFATVLVSDGCTTLSHLSGAVSRADRPQLMRDRLAAFVEKGCWLVPSRGA